MGLKTAIPAILIMLCMAAAASADNDGDAHREGSDTDRPAEFKTYSTRYHVIRTDLGKNVVREAAARLDSLTVEYVSRTQGFSGKARTKMKFYMFARRADYYAAGGPKGTAGLYDGAKLMAVVPDKPDQQFWRIVQHEGFHQFADTVIAPDLPAWLSEGLAEYFGEAIWTGDRYVTGVISNERLKRIRVMIKADNLRPIDEMAELTIQQWNTRLQKRDYDQAWSMVHYLVHAENGKYQKDFAKFVNDIVVGRPWSFAFINRFGEFGNFKRKYTEWWLALGDNPTAEKYDLATMQTLMSFLARTTAEGQSFKNFNAFTTAARDGALRYPKNQWLPQSLLIDVLQRSDGAGKWTLRETKTITALFLRKPDGTLIKGTLARAEGRVGKVSVSVIRPVPAKPPRR